MIKRTTRFIVFVIINLSLASAQKSQVMYYMNLPQNHFMNPALRPLNGFYLGIGITGIGITLNNNFFNLSDVLMPGRSDSVITFLHPDYNVNDFLRKLKKSNFLTPEADIQLFGLGFNAGRQSYVFLDIVERIDGNFSLPGNLIKLGLGGNEDFVGKTMDLTNLDVRMFYFREAGAGLSSYVTKNLRLGFKGKILFGIAGAAIDNNRLSLTVDDDFRHTFNADLMANISGPVKIYFDADNKPDSMDFDEDKIKSPDFYLNTRNFGMGLDFGMVYNVTNRLSLSASITDLGYIKWKDMITNMKAESQFEFSGLNIKDVVNGTKTFEELTNELLDSLKNSFVIEDDKKPFNTFLTPCIGLGVGYNLTKSFGLGLLSRTYIKNGELKEAITVSANLNAGNAFSTSVSYTATTYSFDNLGVGLAFRAGFLQFYFLTDKIPVMWNKVITDDVNIPLPADWKMMNLRFGVNMTLGNRIKKKNDKPMLKVE